MLKNSGRKMLGCSETLGTCFGSARNLLIFDTALEFSSGSSATTPSDGLTVG